MEAEQLRGLPSSYWAVPGNAKDKRAHREPRCGNLEEQSTPKANKNAAVRICQFEGVRNPVTAKTVPQKTPRANAGAVQSIGYGSKRPVGAAICAGARVGAGRPRRKECTALGLLIGSLSYVTLHPIQRL